MDSIVVAKLLAVPATFIIVGYQTAPSQNTLPTISNQPASIATPIFSQVYHRGAKVVVPAAIISAAASGYLAYMTPRQRTQWSAAGLLTVGIVPFTLLFMSKGIHRLIEISGDSVKQETAGQSGEVLRLLRNWVAQNWIRATMTFTSGMLGLWNVVNETT